MWEKSVHWPCKALRIRGTAIIARIKPRGSARGGVVPSAGTGRVVEVPLVGFDLCARGGLHSKAWYRNAQRSQPSTEPPPPPPPPRPETNPTPSSGLTLPSGATNAESCSTMCSTHAPVLLYPDRDFFWPSAVYLSAARTSVEASIPLGVCLFFIHSPTHDTLEHSSTKLGDTPVQLTRPRSCGPRTARSPCRCPTPGSRRACSQPSPPPRERCGCCPSCGVGGTPFRRVSNKQQSQQSVQQRQQQVTQQVTQQFKYGVTNGSMRKS